MCFYTFFGPRDLPRDPQETQEPKMCKKRRQKIEKKSAKKNPNNACCGKKCLKPAISFLIKIGTHFSIYFCTFFLTCFTHFFYHFFEKGWNLFGTHFGIRVAQEGQDEPKRAIRSFKEPKPFIFKNLKKPLVFNGFWLQRPLKRASRGPRRLPKGTQQIQDPKK